MDCSGTIYFLLQKAGIAGAPRSASEQYVWVRKANTFQAVISNRSDSFEFNALRPEIFCFGRGTYAVKSDPPVTHSMIYLGQGALRRASAYYGWRKRRAHAVASKSLA